MGVFASIGRDAASSDLPYDHSNHESAKHRENDFAHTHLLRLAALAHVRNAWKADVALGSPLPDKATMRRPAAISAFVFLLLAGCSERNRMATVDAEGLIDGGKKLGVEVGESQQDATRTLIAQDLQLGGIERGGTCNSPRTFKADYTVQFLDMSWRRGTVCLGITSGRVSQIAWLYNLLSP